MCVCVCVCIKRNNDIDNNNNNNILKVNHFKCPEESHENLSSDLSGKAQIIFSIKKKKRKKTKML